MLVKNWIIAGLVAVIAIGGMACGNGEGQESTPVRSGDGVAQASVSRADYCRILDEARDRLSEDDDYLFLIFELEIMTDETQAWDKLDADPTRQEMIAENLSHQIDAARELIAIEPHPALESLHYEVASAADIYAERTEFLQSAFHQESILKDFARTQFTTMLEARKAAYRTLRTQRCPF